MKNTTSISYLKLLRASLLSDPGLHIIIDANRSKDQLRLQLWLQLRVNNFVTFDWLQAHNYDVN